MRTELRQSVLLTASTGVTAVLSTVYSVLVGRMLGPDDFADVTVAVSIVAVLTMAFGPINGIVARFTAQYACHGAYGRIRTLNREILRRVGLYAAVGLLAGVLAAGPLSRLLRFNSLTPLLFAYGLTYLYLLLSVSRGVLRGMQQFGSYSVNVIAEAAIRLAAGLMLLIALTSVTSALLGHLLAAAAAVALGVWQARRVWRGQAAEPVDGGAVKQYSLAMLVLCVCAAGFQNIDMLMVKNQFSGDDAGQYSAAFTLARSMTALATPFSIMLIPLVSSLHERGHRIGGAVARVCAYFLVLAAGPMLVLGLWPQQITTLLYGPAYATGGTLLAWLTAACFAGNLGGLLGQAHVARSDFRFLYLMVPALVAEAVALTVFDRSLSAIVWAVVLGQSLRLLSVVVMFLLPPRAPARV